MVGPPKYNYLSPEFFSIISFVTMTGNTDSGGGGPLSNISTSLLVSGSIAATALTAAAARAVAKNAGLLHRVDASTDRTLKVVVTGSTRGLGRALARQHAALGDAVCVSGRSASDVAAVVTAMRTEHPNSKVCGCACDVSVPGAARALADYAAVRRTVFSWGRGWFHM